MKKLFEMRISAQPNGFHMKWACVNYIQYQGNAYTLQEFVPYVKTNLHEMIPLIDYVSIQMEEEPGKKPRPYPDFLHIDFFFYGVNDRAIEIMKSLGINFSIKPLHISNDSLAQYHLLYFPQQSLIDLDQMNVEIVDGRIRSVGYSYYDHYASPFVYKPSILNVKGIVRTAEFSNCMICDEQTVKTFKKNKLKGYWLEELPIHAES